MPIRYRTISNNGSDLHLIALNNYKNLVCCQLPQLSRIDVTKTIFDPANSCLIIEKNTDANDPAQFEAVGGAVISVMKELRCCNIIYLVVSSEQQGKGYGTKILNQLKEQMKKVNVQTICLYADAFSVNFYFKNGFIPVPKSAKLQWKKYIDEYESSQLVAYRVHGPLSSQNMKKIVALQRQKLVQRIEGKKYNGHSFRKQQCLQLLKNYRNQSHKSITIQEQRKQQKLVSAAEALSELESQAILAILKAHPNSYLLNVDFNTHKLRSSEHQGLITLADIEKAVARKLLKTSQQTGGYISRSLARLKEALPCSSPYFLKLKDLINDISPYLDRINSGTFNAMEYLNEGKQNEHP